MQSVLQINLWTIVSAFVAVIVAEWLKEFLFAPRQKQRELRARVHAALFFYSNAYPALSKEIPEDQRKRLLDLVRAAEQELRKLAGEVLAVYGGCWPVIRKRKLREAHKDLLHLSNLVYEADERQERVILTWRIAEALKLDGREVDFKPSAKVVLESREKAGPR